MTKNTELEAYLDAVVDEGAGNLREIIMLHLIDPDGPLDDDQKVILKGLFTRHLREGEIPEELARPIQRQLRSLGVAV